MSSRKRSNQLRARALRSSIKEMSIGIPSVIPGREANPESRDSGFSLRLPRNDEHSSVASCKDGHRHSTLRPKITAAFVAAVAVHADARQPAGMRDPLPDEAREVFQRRGPERLDVVEQ